MSEPTRGDAASLIAQEKNRAAQLIRAEQERQRALEKQKTVDFLKQTETPKRKEATYKQSLDHAETAFLAANEGQKTVKELEQFIAERGGIQNTSKEFQDAYNKTKENQQSAALDYARYTAQLESGAINLAEIPEGIDRKNLTPEWFAQKIELVLSSKTSQIATALEHLVNMLSEAQLDPSTQERIIQRVDQELEQKVGTVDLNRYATWVVLRAEITNAMPTIFDGSFKTWMSRIFTLAPTPTAFDRKLASDVMRSQEKLLQDVSQLKETISHMKRGGILGMLGLEKKTFRLKPEDDSLMQRTWTSMWGALRDHRYSHTPQQLPSEKQLALEELNKIEAEIQGRIKGVGLIEQNAEILHPSELAKHMEAEKISAALKAWKEVSAPLRATNAK